MKVTDGRILSLGLLFGHLIALSFNALGDPVPMHHWISLVVVCGVLSVQLKNLFIKDDKSK